MGKVKLVVLIVDDNMKFVDRMISMLEELNNIGYINVAGNYNDAARFLDQERPDLVLLDINLPGKSGIELLRRIKENGNKSEVIMISNQADDYYRKQSRELGAKHFLDKSNEFGRVPEIVGNFGRR
jgi:response regulator of citrate/malate metabolism